MEKETDTAKMMQPVIHKDEEYKVWIAGLVEQFRQGQVAAVIHVNRELLLFYWCLGRDINEMDMEHKYGKGIIHTISMDLQRKLPHIKGLTEKNIYYCKRWYSLYINEFQKFPQPVGKSLESLIAASDINLPQLVGKSDGSGFPKVIAETGWTQTSTTAKERPSTTLTAHCHQRTATWRDNWQKTRTFSITQA